MTPPPRAAARPRATACRGGGHTVEEVGIFLAQHNLRVFERAFAKERINGAMLCDMRSPTSRASASPSSDGTCCGGRARSVRARRQASRAHQATGAAARKRPWTGQGSTAAGAARPRRVRPRLRRVPGQRRGAVSLARHDGQLPAHAQPDAPPRTRPARARLRRRGRPPPRARPRIPPFGAPARTRRPRAVGGRLRRG